MNRHSGSLIALAGILVALPDGKVPFLKALGGRRMVAQILIAAANELLAVEKQRQDQPSDGVDDLNSSARRDPS